MESSVISPDTLIIINNVLVVPHIAFNNHNKTEAETTENKKIYRKKNKQK